MELSQEQLEELDQGKPEPPRATFYEKAVLDTDASKQAGKRIYVTKTYIKLHQPGVKDNMSYAAQQGDVDAYPAEYQHFLSNKQGTRQPGIEIIPHLEIAHLQELRDYGLLTIPQLAEATNVPAHLEYARASAIVLNQALKETRNGPEEESIEEVPSQTENVSPIRGREHGDHVGRSEAARSDGLRDQREVAQGHDPGRRAQRRQGVDWGNVLIA